MVRAKFRKYLVGILCVELENSQIDMKLGMEAN